MSRAHKRNDIAMNGNTFALRAGSALDRLVSGPHRDKTIARMFGVSPRMAQYLRAGLHWTIERLDQASRQLGADFDRILAGDSQEMHVSEMNDIAARLAALEAKINAQEAAGQVRNVETGQVQAQGQGLCGPRRSLGNNARAMGGEVEP